MACHYGKLSFKGEKRDCLIFEDFALLVHMKKLRSGSICHDPKKFEMKHQEATTNREQSFDAILGAQNSF